MGFVCYESSTCRVSPLFGHPFWDELFNLSFRNATLKHTDSMFETFFFCSLHTYHTGVSNPPGRYGDPVKCSTWKELFSCVSFCSYRGLHLSYSLLLPQGIINACGAVGSGCYFGYARFDFISFFVSVVWLVARCFTLGTMLGVNKEYDWCINFSPRMQRKFLPCIFVGVIVE